MYSQPSLSETENMKFDRMQKEECDSSVSDANYDQRKARFLITVLNEKLLQLFKQAQVEEEIFLKLDNETADFGEKMRNSQ